MKGEQIVDRWYTKPLVISEMLDAMFQIIKRNFAALFLISIILLAPFYLIQGVLFWNGGLSFFRQETEGPWYMVFMDKSLEEMVANFSIPQLLSLFAVWFLLFYILMPMAEAATLVAIDQIRRGEKIQPIACIKKAFSRFWALIGGSIVYGVIVFGLIFLVSLVIGALIGLIWLTDGFFGIQALFVSAIILAVLLGIGGLIGLIYISVRLSFYFAVIVFEKVSPGITQSWNLTRKSFWRAFLMATNVMILSWIISGAFEVLFTFLLGYSVLGILLLDFVNIFTYMLVFVGYGVVFFDLKLRNEGTDLKTMMNEYRQQINDVQENSIDLNYNDANFPTDK